MSGNQVRWCSKKCSKLGLKSLYKKRKREQINAYNRKIRKLGIRTKSQIKKEYIICLKCGSTTDIHQHHVKPRRYGGKHEYNIILLCKKHHAEFEKLTSNFWKL